MKQPPSTLSTHQATQAQRFHGIHPALTAAGFPEEEVRESFAAWRKGLTTELFSEGRTLSGWRAFNRDFVASVLSDEWVVALGGYSTAGRCIMEDASEVMGTTWRGPF